jgi:hypothetical protein
MEAKLLERMEEAAPTLPGLESPDDSEQERIGDASHPA